ncbi:MAG: dihydrofolate reductase [Candidatus Omnitrophica bacterium]|jgi:dihydrofolate reductase|nr:dihydrofolate reductase [Candidatus Omnitrophota bacterium]
MKLFHIVGMAENRVIGKDNKLPWHFGADLKNFKALTLGQTLLMGRKTYESIGKPLPGRANFVLTRSAATVCQQDAVQRELPPGTDIQYFNSINNALEAAKTQVVFVMGGAELYAQTMDRIDGIYLTSIPGNYEGDAFYPPIPERFKLQKKHPVPGDDRLELLFYA